MNFPYSVKSAHAGAGVNVSVQLDVKDREGTVRQELAVRLLDVLNGKKVTAPVLNAAQGNRVALAFSAPGKSFSPPCLFVSFTLMSVDNDEIQRVAEVAQKFLTDEISRAILAFMALLAVAGCDPFQVTVDNAVRAYQKRHGN